MPSKKTDKSEQTGKSIRITAPPLPKSLGRDIKSAETTAQKITVHKIASSPTGQPNMQPSLAEDDNINNPETDKAVDDIVAKESDMVLAVDDILAAKRNPVVSESTWKDKLQSVLHSKWTWLGLGLVLIILLGLPLTRYKLLGTIIKKSITLTVTDSQTGTPVSNATVELGGTKLKTDANGQAKLRAGVGQQSVIVAKQYYKTDDSHYFVGFSNDKPLVVRLVATGRLVPIVVDNIISGQPVAGVVIHVLNTTAKTNLKGQTTIALPTRSLRDSATLSLNGFNTKTVNVEITSNLLPANSFTLTPSGSMYFLTNSNGTINVTKANLDGSNPQTVLAGTGHETAATTRLLASRDWQYLVLEANRSGNGPALYLIDTANNQVTEFDSSATLFNLIGWYNHDFIYSLTSTTTSQSQSGSQILKAYDADHNELDLLDQNQAVGNATSYAYQTFNNFFLAGSQVIYDTTWTTVGGYSLSNQDDTIRAFDLDSQTKKDYQSFLATNTVSLTSVRYQPQAIYFAASTTSGTSYYQYDNQTVQPAAINQTIFDQNNPTYVLSPSGSQTVWAKPSNGQDLFLVGDANANNPKQIAALNGYSPYGWYGNNYILASQDNNQLYILPATGLSSGRQPLKISNYYEPATNAQAYEYNGL